MNDGKVMESHPGKPLESHLLGTLELVKQIARKFGIPLARSDELAVLLHDIGKAHPLFQKRLQTGQGKYSHAQPSAALVLSLTRDILCAEAVRRHHAHLQDIAEFVKFWSEWDYNEGRSKVIDRLKWWPGAGKIASFIDREINTWSGLLPDEAGWEDILIEHVDTYGLNKDGLLVEEWLRLRLLYSLLVTADRYEAAVGGGLEYRELRVDETRLEEYIRDLPRKSLSAWREKVRREVVVYTQQVMDKPGVYTLTLPTGAGKTLIGMQIAMEAARRFQAGGIVYVLPFVSLVEQNAAVAGRLFDQVREDHHLAYASEEGEDADSREQFIEFFRYWQEPVVVTTLAKLWDVLFSPRANDTMSLHRLSRAVVILDEPQAIPAGCWEGFGKILELLADKLGSTFILMTATQPEIVRGRELAPREYSFPVVRHELHFVKEKMHIERAAEFLGERGFFEGNSLVVLNTRKSALLMWREFHRRGLKPFFLSRWVTHVDRAKTLQELIDKEKAQGMRYLVATQVIEAGMDLDFALVFRDLGPLDSIIQVAGRCNRHGNGRTGRVFIAELVDEYGRSMAASVYDSVLLAQTRLVLNDHPDFNEKDCRGMVEEYYRLVRGAIDSSLLWCNITEGKWGRNIPLVRQRMPEEAMLIIDYDGTVDGDLEILRRPVAEEVDKMEAIRRKKKIFQKLSLQAVPVPSGMLEEWFRCSGAMVIGDEENVLFHAGGGIWVVRGAGIGRIYRRDVGFIPLDMAELMEA